MMHKHTQIGIAHMTKIQSVDRDKFVVRFDQEGTRHAVEVEAMKLHISMNAWLQQAIDEKLERGARLDRLLDAAERGLI